MKKNFTYLCILLLQLIVIRVSAQSISSSNRRLDNDECQKNAEFIFEGSIIATRSYSNPNSVYEVIVSELINITKVFKGNLKIGTVELIYKASCDVVGSKDDPIMYYEKPNDICNRIFFCKSSNMYPHDRNSSGYTIKNNVILTDYCSYRYRYVIHDSQCRTTRKVLGISGFDSTFISKASLYNYLRNKYQIAIPKSAEKPSDTIASPTYGRYLKEYRRDVLHEKEPTDSELVVKEQKTFRMYRDSVDSIESLKYIIKMKTNIDNHYKEINSPLYYEYYWDGSIRRYMGTVVDPNRKRQTR